MHASVFLSTYPEATCTSHCGTQTDNARNTKVTVYSKDQYDDVFWRIIDVTGFQHEIDKLYLSTS